jgi:thymidylate synthase
MYITANTVDDLLRRVFGRLLSAPQHVTATRGDTTEIIGVLLQLTNPRARISRTEKKQVLFSCLGELLWYLAGSRELAFIEYYLSRYAGESDDGRTVHGAYGPRLFRMRHHNQVEQVLALLKERPTSRRAVIQVFDSVDLAAHHTDVPSTCSLQFLVRKGRLHLFTAMRSNDAYLGLPHDIFAFTMLQEIVARALDVDLGTYKHAVGSLHLYKRHRRDARAFLREGWQESIAMPAMPVGDPWPAIEAVTMCERAIRLRGRLPRSMPELAPYWMDVVRLLRVFRLFRDKDSEAIRNLKQEMTVPVFDMYIDYKRRAVQHKGGQRRRPTRH